MKSVTELDADFEDVRAAMLGHLAALDGLAASAGDDGDRLLVEAGLEVGGHGSAAARGSRSASP